MGKQRKRTKKGKKRKPFSGRACLDLPNTPFGQVVFLEKDKRIHLHLHHELEDPQFISAISKIIKKPNKNLVFKSLIRPWDTLVIYGELASVANSLTARYNFKYIKVVLSIRSKTKRVLTSFGRSYIKEYKKIRI